MALFMTPWPALFFTKSMTFCFSASVYRVPVLAAFFIAFLTDGFFMDFFFRLAGLVEIDFEGEEVVDASSSWYTAAFSLSMEKSFIKTSIFGNAIMV